MKRICTLSVALLWISSTSSISTLSLAQMILGPKEDFSSQNQTTLEQLLPLLTAPQQQAIMKVAGTKGYDLKKLTAATAAPAAAATGLPEEIRKKAAQNPKAALAQVLQTSGVEAFDAAGVKNPKVAIDACIRSIGA